jgi:hypothetical protein
MTDPSALPVRRLTLNKHGVGFVERGGVHTGDELRLTFRGQEVNDVLKSLLVLDRRGGQVLGIHFDTPADTRTRLADLPFRLSHDHAILDLLRGLRGTRVSVEVGEGTQRQEVQGRLLGVEVGREERPAAGASLSIWDEAQSAASLWPLREVRAFRVLDARAAQDLGYLLDASQSEDTRRTVTVRLSEGEHDLSVSYLLPSPTWRVSYRLVAERSAAESAEGTLLLQGWGLFDNRLEEDLENVEVTLVAGQPISFVYDLASSRIPERRVIQDEARVASGPVEFERATMRIASAPAALAGGASFAQESDDYELDAVSAAPARQSMRARFGRGEVAKQGVTATGSELGELFQYRVTAPVSAKRGASALVPILSSELPYRRELVFNQRKMPLHPVVTLRFTNQSGLVFERGPVTVLEDGEYHGEAMVPFTKTGTDVYLAFSVELGIKVTPSTTTRTETAGLRIEKSFIWLRQARVHETAFEIVSDLDAAERVTIEHPIRSGAELVDTPEPTERTEEHYRWAVASVPRGSTTFTVSQRTFDWTQQQVLDLSFEALSEYLRYRWLDRQTMDHIRDLLRESQTIAKNFQEIERLREERDRIYARQEQLRKNLAALSTTGQEAALRTRVFQQLSATEDRLEAIDRRIAELEEEATRRQAALNAALEQLSVPDVAGAP